MSELENLPGTVREIVELVGLQATMALVSKYKGIYLKVPTGRKEDGTTRAALISLMGEEAADKFIGAYGGERVSIPMCDQALRDARDARMIADYDAGVSAAKLAQREGMTERNVRNILKRVPGQSVDGLSGNAGGNGVDDRQLSLL